MMIVPDTNELSEMKRPAPFEKVLHWMAEQPATNLFTTTITQAEIFFALALLPEGRRRSNLLIAAEQMFTEDFADRVLTFDTSSAIEFATIAAKRRKQGRSTRKFRRTNRRYRLVTWGYAGNQKCS
jgi:toxin FitB